MLAKKRNGRKGSVEFYDVGFVSSQEKWDYHKPKGGCSHFLPATRGGGVGGGIKSFGGGFDVIWIGVDWK